MTDFTRNRMQIPRQNQISFFLIVLNRKSTVNYAADFFFYFFSTTDLKATCHFYDTESTRIHHQTAETRIIHIEIGLICIKTAAKSAATPKKVRI